MIKYFFSTLLFIIILKSYSQNIKSEKDLDTSFYLLGMLNDYGGRNISFDNPEKSNYVNHFYCSEKKLSKIFIDSLKYSNKIEKHKFKIDTSGFITIKSDKYSKDFNKFFKVVKVCKNCESKQDNEDIEYDVSLLKLKTRLINNEIKRISYIAGVFMRYGKLDNNNAKLSFGNSFKTFKNSIKFLKKLNFDIKRIEVIDAIPTIQQIDFTIPDKYLIIFSNLNKVKPDTDYDDCN